MAKNKDKNKIKDDQPAALAADNNTKTIGNLTANLDPSVQFTPPVSDCVTPSRTTGKCDFCEGRLDGEQLPDTQPQAIEWCGKEGVACSFCQHPGRARDYFIGYGHGKRSQSDITVDSLGNLYVARDHQVLKFDIYGQRSVFAGKGNPGYLGDKGLAIQAELNAASSLTLQADGSLFILDAGNGVIRKVDKHGIITTFADIK